MRAHCQGQQGLLEILYGFELDAIQKTERTENNVNKLSGSPGKFSFSAPPMLQGKMYVYDYIVQKTKKTEQNVNKLSGPQGKRSLLALNLCLHVS